MNKGYLIMLVINNHLFLIVEFLIFQQKVIHIPIQKAFGSIKLRSSFKCSSSRSDHILEKLAISSSYPTKSKDSGHRNYSEYSDETSGICWNSIFKHLLELEWTVLYD